MRWYEKKPTPCGGKFGDSSEQSGLAAEGPATKEVRAESLSGSSTKFSGYLGLSVGNFQASCGGDSLDVVPARRRLRGGPPEGLPSDENLQKLARVYLETQAELWSDLVGSKWLPRVDQNAIDWLTREHQMRFVEGRLCGFDPPDVIDGWDKLGIAYVRFLAAQSNERSLDDQLYNILRAAATQLTFIPWVWVFADSAASGTRAMRRG